MKLYYMPGTCSLGIHVILEEIGAPYETELVDFSKGAQYQPPFVAINPKSKVPTLVRDNGKVLTEFPVIAHYLADKAPAAHLLPEDEEARLTVLQALDYIVATVHMQGFSRLFRPSNFAPAEAEEAVRQKGRDIVEKGFTVLESNLDGADYLGGDHFSIGDAALFYVEFWGAKRMNVPLPAALAAHFDRMMARPAVQSVMKQEGLA